MKVLKAIGKAIGIVVVIISVFVAMTTGSSKPRTGEIPHIDRPVVDKPVREFPSKLSSLGERVLDKVIKTDPEIAKPAPSSLRIIAIAKAGGVNAQNTTFREVFPKNSYRTELRVRKTSCESTLYDFDKDVRIDLFRIGCIPEMHVFQFEFLDSKNKMVGYFDLLATPCAGEKALATHGIKARYCRVVKDTQSKRSPPHFYVEVQEKPITVTEVSSIPNAKWKIKELTPLIVVADGVPPNRAQSIQESNLPKNSLIKGLWVDYVNNAPSNEGFSGGWTLELQTGKAWKTLTSKIVRRGQNRVVVTIANAPQTTRCRLITFAMNDIHKAGVTTMNIEKVVVYY